MLPLYSSQHIESVHEKKKPFECSICNLSCSREEHVKNHSESVHEGKKFFTAKMSLKNIENRNLPALIAKQFFTAKMSLKNIENRNIYFSNVPIVNLQLIWLQLWSHILKPVCHKLWQELCHKMCQELCHKMRQNLCHKMGLSLIPKVTEMGKRNILNFPRQKK